MQRHFSEHFYWKKGKARLISVLIFVVSFHLRTYWPRSRHFQWKTSVWSRNRHYQLKTSCCQHVHYLLVVSMTLQPIGLGLELFTLIITTVMSRVGFARIRSARADNSHWDIQLCAGWDPSLGLNNWKIEMQWRFTVWRHCTFHKPGGIVWMIHCFGKIQKTISIGCLYTCNSYWTAAT